MCCSRFAWEARRGEDCPRLSAGHTPHLQRAVRWPAQVWLRPTARCALRAAQAVRATHARDETPAASHLLCLSVLLCSRRSHAAKKTGAEAEAEAEVRVRRQRRRRALLAQGKTAVRRGAQRRRAALRRCCAAGRWPHASEDEPDRRGVHLKTRGRSLSSESLPAECAQGENHRAMRWRYLRAIH
jgi:hypothetical protein